MSQAGARGRRLLPLPLRLAAAGTLALASAHAGAQDLEVVTRPIPQAYSNTCQSYALAFALARAGAPGFALADVAGVRAAEARVRAAIAAAAGPGGSPYAHSAWARAVTTLTSGAFALRRREYATADALYGDAVARTGVGAAATLGPVVAATVSRTPVMTSFERIGRDSYATGHIVTVFGVDLPAGPMSAPAGLLLLNSAVKRRPGTTPAFAPVCGSGDPPGATRYTGALALERDYVLKRYGGRFVAFWIEPASSMRSAEAPTRRR